MYFLKCNKCGHLNEIKTEYLVFCTNCNKKLENNFSDWTKINRDKSFDDFKLLMGVTEAIEPPKKISRWKSQKSLKYWIGFSITFAIICLYTQLGTGLLNKPLYDKTLMSYASEINKSCPIMIDNQTRFDNAIALPNNVFQYNYTLIHLKKDSLNITDLKNYVEPTIINFVKTNPEMKTIRDRKTTVNYYYKDRTGVYLFTISVKPEQYK